MIERRHTGAYNELLATVWLLKQGYEVFRNMSQHGAIDLIARRGKEMLLLDVKAMPGAARVGITEEQAEVGVKILIVREDGRCELDLDPPTTNGLLAPRLCPSCGCEFQSAESMQTYCGPKCRPSAYVHKNVKSVRGNRGQFVKHRVPASQGDAEAT